MKLYRVHFRYEHGTSAGFSWYTRKALAERARRENDCVAGNDSTLETYDRPRTVRELMELLRVVGTHADNG